MLGQVHLGDLSTIIELTVYSDDEVAGTVNALDISTATIKRFLITRPDGTLTVVDASFSGSGTDGKLRYTTSASDSFWTQIGEWKVQAWENVSKKYSTVKKINVVANVAPSVTQEGPPALV